MRNRKGVKGMKMERSSFSFHAGDDVGTRQIYRFNSSSSSGTICERGGDDFFYFFIPLKFVLSFYFYFNT